MPKPSWTALLHHIIVTKMIASTSALLLKQLWAASVSSSDNSVPFSHKKECRAEKHVTYETWHLTCEYLLPASEHVVVTVTIRNRLRASFGDDNDDDDCAAGNNSNGSASTTNFLTSHAGSLRAKREAAGTGTRAHAYMLLARSRLSSATTEACLKLR